PRRDFARSSPAIRRPLERCAKSPGAQAHVEKHLEAGHLRLPRASAPTGCRAPLAQIARILDRRPLDHHGALPLPPGQQTRPSASFSRPPSTTGAPSRGNLDRDVREPQSVNNGFEVNALKGLSSSASEAPPFGRSEEASNEGASETGNCVGGCDRRASTH